MKKLESIFLLQYSLPCRQAGTTPLLLAVVCILCFTACQKDQNQKADNEFSYDNEIPVVDEERIKSKIENRNGKILFINFWATWCVPCVEEFPDLVKIYNEHKNSDFEFLSISVDLPSDIETKVKPFLSEQEAGFQVVVIEEKRSEKIINLINPDWNGAVPVTVIYDEDGRRQVFISEAKNYDDFHTSIERVKSI